MRTKVTISVSLLLLCPTGCAIHPLPEDVSGNTTYQIVEKIRCEARDALTALAVRGLRESEYPPTLEVAQWLEDGAITIRQLFGDPQYARKVDPTIHKNFEIFALSAIAFDFTLTGIENNGATASADFTYPFVNGVFGLNIAAGHSLERQNERRLQVGHTFFELYDRTGRAACEQIAFGGGNYTYPMTGKIGLDEVINTFYLLNRPYNPTLKAPVDSRGHANVVAYETNSAGGDIKNVTDTLQFTTAFNGGTTPSVTLTPVAKPIFRLASATTTLSAKRQDIHKVAISIEKGKSVSSFAQALTLSGLRAADQSSRVAKQRAFQRLDDLRTEDFFRSQRQIRQILGLPPL